jgi:DNA-binding beta-propeller fold protein YncE
MRSSASLKKMPAALVACLATALAAAGCEGPFATNPPAQERPLEDTGNLYISLWDQGVVRVFDPWGATLLDELSTPGLEGPRGIAFDPVSSDVWVASERGNAVFIFDRLHALKHTIEHPDFNEPVGVAFRLSAAGEWEIYVSNSGNSSVDPTRGNEVLVFNRAREVLRRFSHDELNDPNCAAFFPDGSFFLTNRLQNRVDRFDAEDTLVSTVSYTRDDGSDGLVSTMAVARTPSGSGSEDDTIWVTGGGGARDLVRFALDGTVLRVLDQATLRDTTGDATLLLTPQGLAFDEGGRLLVVSLNGQVLRFDREGTLLGTDGQPYTLGAPFAWSPGAGSSRSIAVQLHPHFHF